MSCNMPRVAAIHDLSGIGRCSLSVILPVLACMGVQACPVPTAVLSTHTGGFGVPAICDLSDFIASCITHWKSIDAQFDCVYSGFLADGAQAELVDRFLDGGPRALAVVDPVMGDNGRPYRTCTPALREKMTALIRRANLITPNMTEACILLKEDYHVITGRDEARSFLARLSEKGPEKVVITGVSMESGSVTNLGYDRATSSFWRVDGKLIRESYPGTGDVFASVLVGGLLTGDSLPLSMARAAQFVQLAAATAFGYHSQPREGVLLEKALPWLVERRVLTGYEPL
jgi:pyridoxine kinase